MRKSTQERMKSDRARYQIRQISKTISTPVELEATLERLSPEPEQRDVLRRMFAEVLPFPVEQAPAQVQQ